jgi:hypothetical protein
VDGAALRALGEVASVLGQSRLWGSADGEHRYQVYVPLADMLNHKTGANALNEDMECGGLGSDGAPCKFLRAPHAIAEGEELFDSYSDVRSYDGNAMLVNTCALVCAWCTKPRVCALPPPSPPPRPPSITAVRAHSSHRPARPTVPLRVA